MRVMWKWPERRVSGPARLAAVRQLGSSGTAAAGFSANICQPSTLRVVIWPGASITQNSTTAVSADGGQCGHERGQKYAAAIAPLTSPGHDPWCSVVTLRSKGGMPGICRSPNPSRCGRCASRHGPARSMPARNACPPRACANAQVSASSIHLCQTASGTQPRATPKTRLPPLR